MPTTLERGSKVENEIKRLKKLSVRGLIGALSLVLQGEIDAIQNAVDLVAKIKVLVSRQIKLGGNEYLVGLFNEQIDVLSKVTSILRSRSIDNRGLGNIIRELERWKD